MISTTNSAIGLETRRDNNGLRRISLKYGTGNFFNGNQELCLPNREAFWRSGVSPHVPLSKTRLETLCLLIVAVISARTVNLSHIASERAGDVLVASTYRWLQRFFQFVALPEDWSAHLVVQLLGVSGPWYLCLDRTNWKVGKRDVNIPMLAIHCPAGDCTAICREG